MQALLIAITLLGSHLPPQATPARSGVTAFVGATLLDGTGAAAVSDAVLLVDGAKIMAVGPRGRVAVPEGVAVINLAGAWIVPGLIDAHVHFFQSGGLYTRPDVIDLRDRRSYADELAGIRRRLELTFARYLACGITSVADVGGPFWNFDVREQARKTPLAPRVFVAGPLVSTYAPEALKTEDPPIIKVDTPEEARALVRREVERKPDLVKIWFIRQPGKELAELVPIVRATIEESHAAQVRVAVHATQLETARAAVEAGADVLVHSVDDRNVDDAFVEALRKNGVVYTTTLVVYEGYGEVLGQRVDLNDIERRLGDPEVIASWDDIAKLPAGKRPSPRAMQRAPTAAALANLKRLQDGGVTIAAGTDAGNIGTLHGPSLHREFELMAKAGLTPMQILVAATRGSAHVISANPDLGTLEPGKFADFLILDADPLADIVNLRKIRSVVKGGSVLDPSQILPAPK